MNKDNIIEKIKDGITDLVFAGIKPFDLYIGGGSALSLLSNNFRPTSDIDIAKSLANNEVRSILMDFDINDHMATSLDPNISDYIGDVTKISTLIFEHEGFKIYALWVEAILTINSVISDQKKHADDIKYYLTKELDIISITKLEISYEVMKVWVERNGETEPSLMYATHMIEKFKKKKGA